jgi:hypothetical protein
MSGTEWSPIGLSLEDEKAYLDALNRNTLIVGGKALSSAITNVAPDPSLPGAAGYIPFTGAGERLAGFAGGLLNVVPPLLNPALHALGFKTTLPQAPVGKVLADVGERANKTQDQIYSQIGAPTVDPTNPGEQLLSSIGTGMGAMAPVAPGAALTSLPRAIGGAAKWVVPTTENAMANVGIATGFGTAAGVLDAQDAQAVQPTPPPTPEPTTQPQTIAQMLSAAGTPPETKQPTDTQSAAVAASAPTGPATIAQILSGAGPAVQPAPTFGEEGEAGMTVSHALLYAAGLLLPVLAGMRMTQAARDARMADPAYAQAAADYNASKIARTGNDISTGVDEKAPAAPMAQSSPVQTAASNVVDTLINSNRNFQNYTKLTADNPQASQQLASQFGLTHTNAAWEIRQGEFMQTGVDHTTGLSMPPPKRLYQDIARLPTASKKLLQDGLMAENEMDNRAINAQRLRQAGTPFSPGDLRHDFYNQNTPQLDAIAQQARSDPIVNELMDRFQLIGKRSIEMGLPRGFFSPTEARDILTQHPRYVSDVDVNGRVIHPMGRRVTDRYTGVEQVNTTPWAAQAQHLDALFRQYELNDMRRAAVDHQLGVQIRYPNSAQFVYEKVIPTGQVQPTLYPSVGDPVSGAREPTIAVRRATGTQYYRVDNPDWFNNVSGQNSNRQRIATNSMSIQRRLFSQMTTGLGSVATGRIFPFVNAIRTAIQAPINRPQGYAGGLIDRGVQAATRGRLGYRGLDPTNLGVAAYSYGRGRFDRAAMHLSGVFDSTNQNFVNQHLRSMITPAQVDRLSQSLRDFYMRSTTHEMRALGVGGGGTPFRSELPAYNAAQGDKVRMTANAQVPELFMANGKLGSARPYVIKLRRALEAEFSGISDAMHEGFFRINRGRAGMDPRSLAYETRQLTGDPGTVGSSMAVAHVANTLPYANVSLQGIARRGRAMVETPIGTSAAWIGGLGSIALLSILTSMRSPEHMKHLEEGLNTQQREANPTFYTHPDPRINTQINLAQEDRLVYPWLLDMISKGINLTAARQDPGVFNDLHGFLQDYFNEHIEKSTMESAMHALNDVVNFAQVPPIVNGIMAASGNTIELDWDKIKNDWQNGTLSFDSLVRKGGASAALPNRSPGDTILDDENGKRLSLILSNMFGAGGAIVDMMRNAKHAYDRTGLSWDTLGTVGHDWLQGAKDANPSMNTLLWENQARQSTRPPIAETAQLSMDAMAKTAGAKTAEKYEGMTGPKGLPTAPQPDAGSKVPTDPVMRDMYFTVAAHHAFIQSRLMPDINNIRKQMASADTMPKNQETRDWMNARTRDLADKWRNVWTHIQDVNAILSKKVGAPVNVRSIDWSKGPEQFQ